MSKKNEEYRRNAESRFASPEDNAGIGYYDEQGNQLSPEEFSRLVARDAARIKAARDAGKS